MFVSFPTSQDGTLKATSSYVVQGTKSRFLMGMLKKGVSGVLGPLSCSRTHPYAPRAKAPAALLSAPF